jgi:hypothetical protein
MTDAQGQVLLLLLLLAAACWLLLLLTPLLPAAPSGCSVEHAAQHGPALQEHGQTAGVGASVSRPLAITADLTRV